jgi:beta-lactamase regulating signal transducer with metallopeptidase domain
MSFATQQIAQHLVAGVINSLPVGFALAALTALLLRFTRTASASARFAVWFSALAALPLVGFLHAPATTLSGEHTHVGINMPGSWAVPAFAVWAAIASVILVRIAAGIWRIRQVRRSCVPVAKENLPTGVMEFLSAHSSREVELCTSRLVHVPAAVGLFKPAIVLPEWALSDLSPDQLSAIVGHELAHLQRWDDWSNLAQKILRAVLFFHPAAWWIERELSLAREMACDDAALAHASGAREYAASLVAVAEKSMMNRSISLAQAAVHRARETSLRIARLLALNGKGKPQTWRPAAVMVAGLAAAVFMIEPEMPHLIAFNDDGVPIVASQSPAVPTTRLLRETRTQPLVTQANYPESNPDKVFPASMKGTARKPYLRPASHKAQPAPQMLVIFQNASFDRHGNSTWNVYVLRVKWAGDVQVVNREPSKRT